LLSVLKQFYIRAHAGEDYENALLKDKEFPLPEAIKRVKTISPEREKIKESVDLCLKLNVDPTQGDQNIRGTCILPSGTGKEIKLAVFTDPEQEEMAMKAGADFFGNEDLLKQFQEGTVHFDKCIAT